MPFMSACNCRQHQGGVEAHPAGILWIEHASRRVFTSYAPEEGSPWRDLWVQCVRMRDERGSQVTAQTSLPIYCVALLALQS